MGPNASPGRGRTSYLSRTSYLRLQCSTSHKTWSSVHRQVLQMLPGWVLTGLPLVITRKGAIEREVLDSMNEQLIGTDGGAAAVAKMLQRNRKEEYVRRHARYTELCIQHAASPQQRLFPPKPPAEFNTFKDTSPILSWQPRSLWCPHPGSGPGLENGGKGQYG